MHSSELVLKMKWEYTGKMQLEQSQKYPIAFGWAEKGGGEGKKREENL